MNDQDFFKQVVAVSPHIMYIYDVHEQAIVYANKECERFLGHSTEELRAMGEQYFGEILHPDCVAESRTRFNQFDQLNDGDTIEVEQRVRHHSGEWRWSQSKEVVFKRDADGAVQQILGVSQDITEKRLTELSLEQSNLMLKESQRMAGLGSWVFDYNTQHIDWSEPMFDIFEWDRSNPPDWVTFFSNIHPEDRERINTNLDALLWDQEAADTEDQVYRYITSSGRVIHFKSYTEVQRDADGKILRIMGYGQDLTSRLETEAALKDSENKIRLIVENAGVILLTLTGEGKFTYVSPSSNKIVNYDAESIIGLHFSDIVHRDDAHRIGDAITAIFKNKQTQTVPNYRVIHPDKSWRRHSLTLTASLNSKGEISQLIGVARDVTDLVNAEKELKISQERWSYALEGSQDGVWDANIQEGTVFVSKMWKEMLGYVDEEIGNDSMAWEILLHPEDKERVQHEVSDHLSGKTEHYITEYRLRCKDGSYKWILARGKVIDWHKGKPIRFIGVHTDISERKMMEEHLREAQQLAKVGTYEIDIINEKPHYTKTALEILGLPTSHQPTQDDFDRIVHLDDADSVFDAWEDAIVHTRSFDQEYRIVKEGKVRYIHAVGTPVLNDSGVLIRMVGSLQDITDRIETEIATREANERYTIAMQAAGIGSWEWLIKEEKLVWDDQMFAIYDIDKETATNTYQDYERQLHPDDKDRVNDELNEVLSGGKDFYSTFRIVWDDGTIRYIQAASKTYYDLNGEAYRMIGVNLDITEQRQAQSELSLNNKFLENLIENLPVAVFTKEPEGGKFSRWNKAAEEIFGIPRDKAIGKSVFDLFPKDQADFFWRKDAEVVETGLPVDIQEEEVDTEDKGKRILHTVKTPILNDKGEIETILGISDDITTRKESEDKIRESEERNRGLVDAIPDMMFRLNQKGIYLDFKAGKRKILIPEGDIIGESLATTAIPQDVRSRLMYFIGEAIKTGETQNLEYDLLLPNGQMRSYEVRMSKSGFDEVICIVRDITERKEAERAVAESTEKSRRYIEMANDAILISDQETGEIIEANNKSEALLGKPLNEIVGTYLQDIYPGDKVEEYISSFKQDVPEMGGTLRDMQVVHTDGRIITVDISVTVVEIGGRNHMIGVYHDISDRIKSEKELIDAKEKAEQASTAKAQFLSTMSHEIRTPLNAVIGMTHLLLQENPKAEQIDNLDTLKFSAENLLVIINDILDFSKIDAGKIEFEEIDFDIKDLVKSIKGSMQQQADENQIQLKLLFDDEIPNYLIGDPIRVSQVISNLLNNAIKFTSDGQVTIEAHIRKIEREQVTLEVAITDTGIGITEDKLPTVFSPFTQASSDTTRRYGGTGLGLAICSRLLELMGTELLVESEEGKGSKFYFSLTLQKSKRVDKPASRSFKPGDFHSLDGLRVLVVEDNEINQMVVQKFLTKWEVAMDMANNGQEALVLLEKNEYDVILMDLQMPLMDGYTATKEIRQRVNAAYNKIPIVAVTASAMLEIRDQVYAAGMNDYITKPFNPKDLYRKLAKYAGKPLEY